jgi:peptidoglycan/LPS O-acetylase OafA/YrhL
MPSSSRHHHDETQTGFESLRVVAAQLLLATAADAAFGTRDLAPSRTLATRLPALIAPLAATAHLAHMSRPSAGSAAVARGLDTAVAAAGIGAALAGLIVGGRSEKRSLSTLALASAGVLGLVVDRYERENAAERARLRRRASVVERLVPRRRPRLDHVVIHA